LRCLTADSADSNERFGTRSVGPVHLFSSQFQNWFEEPNAWIAYCKLRGMDADGQASGSGRDVIAGQGSLPALIQTPFGIQCKRVRRDDCPGVQSVPNPCVQFSPHFASGGIRILAPI
jgi:hypothetical protein